MICPACGTPNRADARFCRNCGASLVDPAPISPAPASDENPAPADMISMPAPDLGAGPAAGGEAATAPDLAGATEFPDEQPGPRLAEPAASAAEAAEPDEASRAEQPESVQVTARANGAESSAAASPAPDADASELPAAGPAMPEA